MLGGGAVERGVGGEWGGGEGKKNKVVEHQMMVIWRWVAGEYQRTTPITAHHRYRNNEQQFMAYHNAPRRPEYQALRWSSTTTSSRPPEKWSHGVVQVWWGACPAQLRNVDTRHAHAFHAKGRMSPPGECRSIRHVDIPPEGGGRGAWGVAALGCAPATICTRLTAEECHRRQ